jgi:preprotein translocase subunit SecF
VQSDIENLLGEKVIEDEVRNNLFGRKKRKFKNLDKGTFASFSRILMISILFEGYFVSNYIMGGNKIKILESLFPEFN